MTLRPMARHLEAPPSGPSTSPSSLERLRLSAPRSEGSTPTARGGTKVRLVRDGGAELCTIKVTRHGRHCHSDRNGQQWQQEHCVNA
jgi:hypothetical protein